MIEHESGAASKAVSYIYGTIMSRLPKSYKRVDAIQGRQTASCGEIDQAGRGGASAAICGERSRLSAAPASAETPRIEETVAIPSWHFLSVPVWSLSLSSALPGQHCAQLQTRNSLSGVWCREQCGRSRWLGAERVARGEPPMQPFIPPSRLFWKIGVNDNYLEGNKWIT